jgi:6-phosphogluconolactonase
VTPTLEVEPDADAATRQVGSLVAERAAAAIAERGAFTLALSRARRELLAPLVRAAPPWEATAVYQVDERVAPAGTPERNLTAILAVLPAVAVDSLRPMPVEAPDLDDAARLYEDALPERLDLVHLGLGPDGHTASLLPGDEVLDLRDRLVAATGEHHGFRRMTLTYPALEAAREIVWLVTGEEKRDVLARLLDRDESIPAGRVKNENQLVVADRAAAP